MKQLRFQLLALLLLPAFVLVSCDDPADDHDHHGEQEMITRIVVKFDEVGSNNSVSLVWNDPDGDGEGDFTGAVVLRSGSQYFGKVELFNDLATNPADRNVTREIKDEGDHHQFFYTFSGSLAPFVSTVITDKDKDGFPVGLEFTATVAELPAIATSVTGTLNIVLSHYTSIVKNGTVPGNEEDINITAPITINR